MNRNEQDQAMQAQIDSWTNRATMIGELIPIVKSFSGKVYNCRFDNAVRALRKEAARSDDRIEHGSAYVWSRDGANGRRYVVINTDISYRAGNYWNQCHCKESWIDLILTVPEGGKAPRIDGPATIEKCREKLETLQTEINDAIKAREQLEEAEKLIMQARELISKARELTNAGMSFQEIYKTRWSLKEGY